MSANISYALENFTRETARQAGERATRRLNRMFGALSATNEAILRAKTEQELYQLVCDASVHGGKSLATFVLLKEQDSALAETRRRHRSRTWDRRARPATPPIPAIPMAAASPVRSSARKSPRSNATSPVAPRARSGSRQHQHGRRGLRCGAPWSSTARASASSCPSSATPGQRTRRSSRSCCASPRMCALPSKISTVKPRRR